MHYYQFNIKAYHAATAHLSPSEDLAYRRLIDHYMDTEQPIPDDFVKVARRLRVSEDAVQTVLIEFFTTTRDGWRNDKCDAQIAAYHAQSERNAINGKKGGRPRKNPVETERVKRIKKPTETQSQPTGKPIESETKGNKELKTNNNKQITNNKTKPAAIASGRSRATWVDGLMAIGVSEQVAFDYLAVRKAKRSPLTQTALDQIQREADKAGITLAEAITIATGNSWVGFKAEWLNKPEVKSFIAQHTDREWRESFISKHSDRSWAEGLEI